MGKVIDKLKSKVRGIKYHESGAQEKRLMDRATVFSTSLKKGQEVTVIDSKNNTYGTYVVGRGWKNKKNKR